MYVTRSSVAFAPIDVSGIAISANSPLVAVVGAVALFTDWSKVGDQLFNPQVAADMLPELPRAFWNTIRYTLGAFAVGLSAGTLLALMKLSSVRVYR